MRLSCTILASKEPPRVHFSASRAPSGLTLAQPGERTVSCVFRDSWRLCPREDGKRQWIKFYKLLFNIYKVHMHCFFHSRSFLIPRHIKLCKPVITTPHILTPLFPLNLHTWFTNNGLSICPYGTELVQDKVVSETCMASGSAVLKASRCQCAHAYTSAEC